MRRSQKIKNMLGAVCIAAIMALAGCEESNVGDISAVAISPSGDYQAELVQISYGATGGESVIYVETSDGKEFPIVGEHNTENSIRINETKSSWSAEGEIRWISDDSFIVIRKSSFMTYYKVEIDGDKYRLTEGLAVDGAKCTFHERTITGDTIEITATVYVKNTIDDTVFFSAQSYVTTGGFPRGLVTATAENDLATGERLMIGPNQEKYFDIKLVGQKKTDEEYLNETPMSVYVQITQIGNDET